MATQKFMGSGQLLQRLTAQLNSSGFKGDAEAAAKGILVQRGQMTEDGAYTKAGAARNAMTAEDRAVDRATKKYGGAATQYRYDPKTNRATKK